MNNFKFTIAYDGTRYHGWQVQPGVPTIQGRLEETLQRILDHAVSVCGAGRTDRGVHAEGQVAHCRTDRPMKEDTLQRALNALLPPDIRIMEAARVSPQFHARYSAVARTYRYHICRMASIHPFRYRYVHAYRRPLDAEAIDRATACLIGAHDFSSLCSGAGSVKSPIREVYEAEWQRTPDDWVFTIRANGFLRGMVRTIVGTLLEVGTSRMEWQEMTRVLEARDRAAAGPSVPASGLSLVRVEYSEGADNRGQNNNLVI